MSLAIDLDITLEVEYHYDHDPKPERAYPIDILSVKWRGMDVLSRFLSVHDVMTLQRRVLNRLDDLAEI